MKKPFLILSLLCLALASCEVYDGETPGDPFSGSLKSLSDNIREKSIAVPLTSLQMALQVDYVLSLSEEQRSAKEFRTFSNALYSNSNGYIIKDVATLSTDGKSLLNEIGSEWTLSTNQQGSTTLTKVDDSLWRAVRKFELNGVEIDAVSDFRLESGADPLDYVWSINVVSSNYEEDSGYKAEFSSDGLGCHLNENYTAFDINLLEYDFLWQGRLVMDVSKEGKLLDRMYTFFDGGIYDASYMKVHLGD